MQRRQSKANLKIIFRPCRTGDLQNLEWFGMFYDHRNIILESFRRHRSGKNYMIVAEANSFPIGQVWIDLEKKRIEDTGIIWALRVLPPFQRMGIGTDLIKISEDYLRKKGYLISEICVEKENVSAKRLYERLGYVLIDELVEHYSFVTPTGSTIKGSSKQWKLQKVLSEVSDNLAIPSPGKLSRAELLA